MQLRVQKFVVLGKRCDTQQTLSAVPGHMQRCKTKDRDKAVRGILVTGPYATHLKWLSFWHTLVCHVGIHVGIRVT